MSSTILSNILTTYKTMTRKLIITFVKAWLVICLVLKAQKFKKEFLDNFLKFLKIYIADQIYEFHWKCFYQIEFLDISFFSFSMTRDFR